MSIRGVSKNFRAKRPDLTPSLYILTGSLLYPKREDTVYADSHLISFCLAKPLGTRHGRQFEEVHLSEARIRLAIEHHVSIRRKVHMKKRPRKTRMILMKLVQETRN